MQTLHWVDPKDPVVQTWPLDGIAIIRGIGSQYNNYSTSIVGWLNTNLANNLVEGEEVHVALIDDGTHYRDTEYYQRSDQEGLDIPSSYWLGAPAHHEKRVSKKDRANPAGRKVRGQTESGRRKSKARLDR